MFKEKKEKGQDWNLPAIASHSDEFRASHGHARMRRKNFKRRRTCRTERRDEKIRVQVRTHGRREGTATTNEPGLSPATKWRSRPTAKTATVIATRNRNEWETERNLKLFSLIVLAWVINLKSGKIVKNYGIIASNMIEQTEKISHLQTEETCTDEMWEQQSKCNWHPENCHHNHMQLEGDVTNDLVHIKYHRIDKNRWHRVLKEVFFSSSRFPPRNSRV